MAALFVGVTSGQVAAPPNDRPATPKPAAAAPVQPAGEGETAVRAAHPPLDVVGTGPAVDLKPKWARGDEVKFEFEFSNRSTTQLEGPDPRKASQQYKQEGRIVRRVLAVDGTGVTLSLMMERLYVQVASAGQIIRYDSDWGDDPSRQSDLTAPVKLCVGRPITVKLSPAGEVVGIEGNESPEVDPSNPEAAAKAQIPQAILGTVVIRKLWKPLYRLDRVGFDGHVGDKWTTDDYSTEPSTGTFELTFHHELKEVKDGVAAIAVNADVKLTPAFGPGAVPANLDASTIEGAIEWDAAKGMLKSWTTRQEMQLSAERGGAKQKAKTELKTSFKRLDPGAAPAKSESSASKEAPKQEPKQ